MSEIALRLWIVAGALVARTLVTGALFTGVLFTAGAGLAATPAAGKATASKPVDVEPEAVLVIEKQLSRLSDEAARDTGSVHPRHASQAAYHLLDGLAAGRPEIKDLTDADRQTFGLDAYRKTSVALFEINPRTRVALVEMWIHDESGSHALRRHSLHVLRYGRWRYVGSGEIAASAE